MAKPSSTTGAHMLLLLGDGATPEVYPSKSLCGLTTKTFGRSAKASEFDVPDCDNPDAPGWVERVVQSLSASISGDGILDADALDDWDDFFESGESRNVRVRFDAPSVIAGRTYQGAYVLTKFDFKGETKGKMQYSIELQSDGEVSRSTT